MNDPDRIAYLKSMQGTHCAFVNGNCAFNNTMHCAKKSVLNHCNVLREHYKEAACSIPSEKT